jgi:hypothetical protein
MRIKSERRFSIRPPDTRRLDVILLPCSHGVISLLFGPLDIPPKKVRRETAARVDLDWAHVTVPETGAFVIENVTGSM